MSNIGKGLIAGFAATLVLSALMMMKTAMGVMPELDVIAMLATMTGGGVTMAWIMHFVIGTVLWGGLFAIVEPRWPGNGYAVQGMALGVAVWLLMMVIVMPMAGAGLFGLNLGIMAPVMTLVLHLIFGAVLGAVYGAVGNRVASV